MQTLRSIVALILTASASAAYAQQGPPVRQLGPVVASTTEPQAIAGVRALSTGEVLVNDPATRRVLLFAPDLTSHVVVADSTSATGNAYAGRFAALVAYRGDSTLFVDPMSMSMLVLDPDGRVARVMSIPRSQDAGALAGGTLGGAQFDPAGRLVYRAPPAFGMRPTSAGGMPTPVEQPDSAALLRVDLATRQLDTVAFIKIPKLNFQVTRSESGAIRMQSEINPLPVVDDWSVLSDGTIAIVRGADYRVDLIAPDGSRRSSGRVPFDWQRLSDDDKVEFMDSVKVAYERRQAAGELGIGGAMGAGAMGGGMAGGMGGGANIVIRQGPGPGGGSASNAPVTPQLTFIEPDKLPDYRPPFFAGAVRVDADGNIWVRTTRSVGGAQIHDVLDGEGRLIDRVQVPEGRTIVGFAPDGVYLYSRDGSTTRLEHARLR